MSGQMSYIKSTPIKPCFRWVGGKRWFIKQLKNFLPKSFHNYHEPFLGGASVFLSLNVSGISYLSDANSELIETYIAIRDNLDAVIEELSSYENDKDFYYLIRDQNFEDPIPKAARFIYLNQTSFNGIYRVNLEGKYNVPFGFRKKDFINKKSLMDVSDALQGVQLIARDFDIVKEHLQEGDLVFLDPPYTVSHNQNGFIKYNQKIFSLDDQLRLKKLIDYIKEFKAYYLLTNAAHCKIKEIFGEDECFEVTRSSLIGGSNARRGPVKEYIFTNIKS